MKEKIRYILPVQLLFAVTILLYGPIEIYTLNSHEFIFAFKDFGVVLLVASLGYVAVMTFVLCVLKKFGEVINSFIFAFSICCYIQAMFLNGQMKVLNDKAIVWSNGMQILTLLLWILIFVLFIIMCQKNRGLGNGIKQYVSYLLVLMQLAAFVVSMFTTNILTETKNGYVSTNNMFELSSDKNVVVFLLDAYREDIFESVEEQYPELVDEFSDFTLYPDTISMFNTTYPSIVYLMTGEKCRYDLPPETFVNNAYNKTSFVPSLVDNGISVGLYTFPNYIGNNIKDLVDNYESANVAVKPIPTIKHMLKMVLYRDMPYCIKNRFKYSTYQINNEIVSRERLENGQNEAMSQGIEGYQNFNDDWFEEKVNSASMDVAEKKGCFRFYHLCSVHQDYSNHILPAVHSMKIVTEYINMMKNTGTYENAMIIVMADHGLSVFGEEPVNDATNIPLFMIKYPNTSSPEYIRDEKAISYSDFRPTILKYFEMSYDNEEGQPIDEIEVGTRKRVFNRVYDDLNYGETELIEYEIDGYAGNPENYKEIGSWEVIYSENPVARDNR